MPDRLLERARFGATMSIDRARREFLRNDLDPFSVARFCSRYQRANHTEMRHDEHVLPRTVFREVARELVRSFAMG